MEAPFARRSHKVGQLSIALAAALAAALIGGPAPAGAAQSQCSGADSIPGQIPAPPVQLPLLPAPPAPSPLSIDDYEAAVVCVTNEERARRGLAPLSVNGKLAKAASAHSSQMVDRGFFSHDSANGTSFTKRLLATGYTRGARKWKLTENLAWGSGTQGTVNYLVDGWISSPAHRVNLFDPKVRDIGVGAVQGSPSNPNASTAITLTADYGLAVKKKPGK